jgi:alkyl sulfatase BDS1-like metallo-beta-lactamase superfamily hydrolase
MRKAFTASTAAALSVAATLAMAAQSAAAQQPASEATRTVQAQAQTAETGDAAREAAEDAAAARGLLAQIPDGVIRGADGAILWDWRPYAFLSAERAPDTVNPRLWRQARRNANHGLFAVVPDAIWQVRGYDLSVMTVIRGQRGWIIVDPLTTQEAAAAALALVNRTLGQRPVSAVIFSHSHADHFGGVDGVVDRADVAAGRVPVIAPHGFAEEAVSENVLAGPAMNRRAAYMFGLLLAPGATGQVDTGLGPRLAGGTTGFLAPTVTIGAEGGTRTIDGVEFRFLDAASTEAPAELVFYLPRWHALHSTEVVTKTLHNLLTLRGALVRDALVWSRVIDTMLQRWGADAQVQLASHGWPTFGGDNVRTMLADQRDMYRFIHDRALGEANRGATMQELPALLAAANPDVDPSVRGYYGTINHDAKAVYQRYFGWWDGVPAHYDPVPPVEQARGYVALAGGAERLLAAGRAAAAAGNYRWAAELLNHLVFADASNQPARAALADAYEQLGYQAESGAWRNYYLGAAATLRGTEAATSGAARSQSASFVSAIPTLALFDSLATRLSGPAWHGPAQHFRFTFPDTGETIIVERRGSVEVPRLVTAEEAAATQPVATVRVTRMAFAALLGGRARMPDLLASGQLGLDGDVPALQAWLAAHRPPDPNFAVVTP